MTLAHLRISGNLPVSKEELIKLEIRNEKIKALADKML